VKCLVTGATGFVGSRLVPYLTERGHSVLAFSQSGANLPNGIPTTAVDLNRQTIPATAFAGVDVVIHLAGIAHQHAKVADYDSLIVRASTQLAQQAAESGVSRFIFLSSVKAMGVPPSAAPRSEAHCTTSLTPYGAAKLAAEEALAAAHPGPDMALTVIRPALVYGGRAKGNLALLEKAARLGLPRPPDAGRRSMLGLPALLSLMGALVEGPAQPGQTWIACDDESYSAAQIYDLMRRAMGRSTRTSRLPLWLWRAVTAVLDIARHRTNDSTYEKLFGTELYSNQAARDGAHWTPGSSLSAWTSTLSAESGAEL